jgi:2-polyprenyl-3-methyl-5-hydroxy-6-metoxy-1,4-benzoquinol methylase
MEGTDLEAVASEVETPDVFPDLLVRLAGVEPKGTNPCEGRGDFGEACKEGPERSMHRVANAETAAEPLYDGLVEEAAAGSERAVACWACGAVAVAAADLGGTAFYECESCGFAFQPRRDPRLSGLYDQEYFATYDDGRPYARDEGERRLEARVRLAFVRRFIRSGRLLEIGSAAGYFVAAARSAGFDASGIEPNAEMAEFARRELGVPVRAGTAEDAELAEEPLNAVCGWHVLEHLVSPARALRRLRAAMAPEGLIFFEVPNFGSVRARRERSAWRYLDPVHHVGQYTPAALEALLERSGFAVLTVVTVPWAVYKRWPRSLLSYGRQTLFVGAAAFGEHAWKHELLRVAARVAPAPPDG